MKEIIKNIFNKVEFKIIIGTVYLASLIFSIFPENIISYLGLLSFKQNYQFIISLIFIILTCYYISMIIHFLLDKIKNKLLTKKLRRMMKKISPDEKKYLMKFYNNDSKIFNTSTIFDMSDAIVNLLQSKRIINIGSSLSVAYTEFDYYLQPWALEYLNELLNDGKIKINGNTFEWNDN